MLAPQRTSGPSSRTAVERVADALADDAGRVGAHVGLEEHHELVAAQAREGAIRN